MKFEIGQKVVYPNQGVAVIRKLVTRRIGGIKGEYYVLEIESVNSTVMVPASNIDQIGLRKLSSPDQLKKLYKALQRTDYELDSDWKQRYRDNLEKMQGGTLEEIGEVVKGLHCLSLEKNLGLRDQKILDAATQLIVSEIAAIQNISETRASEELTTLLSTPAVGQD